ncbi:MAG TPA: TrkA family potassium uptake protein [Spirochaetia bacterium]|nr:TrkA family potassium uptake protein [Spirochaetia bacterium]
MAKDRERVFIVVGLGTFGRSVCEVLSAKGAKVIAVDQDPVLVERIKDQVTQAVLLDSTDEESLSNIPLEDADFGVVAIGDKIEASILTTAILKKAGIPYILARSVNELHSRVLRQVGADEVINVEIDVGTRIASRLISPQILDRIPISQTISMAEIYASKAFWGKSLTSLDLRRNANITVIAVKRNTVSVDEMGNPLKAEEIIFPDAQTVLKESDILLVVGRNDDIELFKDL